MFAVSKFKKRKEKKKRKKDIVGHRFWACLTCTCVQLMSDMGTGPKMPCPCNISYRKANKFDNALARRGALLSQDFVAQLRCCRCFV